MLKKWRKLGYGVSVDVMNSKHYGITQNRKRLWIYVYQGTLPLGFSLAPQKEELKTFFKDFLDKKTNASLFKTRKQIEILAELFGLDFSRVKEPSCTDLYNKKIRSN